MPSTKAARSCLSANFGVSLASGAVCVDPALETIEGIVHSGRVSLATGTFTDENLHLVPVTLSDPLDNSQWSYDLIRFVAAPGAVVVTTERAPAGDGPVRVVGLR